MVFWTYFVQSDMKIHLYIWNGCIIDKKLMFYAWNKGEYCMKTVLPVLRGASLKVREKQNQRQDRDKRYKQEKYK